MPVFQGNLDWFQKLSLFVHCLWRLDFLRLQFPDGGSLLLPCILVGEDSSLFGLTNTLTDAGRLMRASSRAFLFIHTSVLPRKLQSHRVKCNSPRGLQLLSSFVETSLSPFIPFSRTEFFCYNIETRERRRWFENGDGNQVMKRLVK